MWLQRLQEKNVIFITGTDEHGEKIAASAEASGRNPKEHCDAISSSYKTLWADVCLQHQVSVYNTFNYIVNHELSFALQIYFTFLQLDIEYDKFIRTTDRKHEAVVNEFYSRVLNSGDIYRADYEGLYCVSCEEYKVSFCLNFLASYQAVSNPLW
jgi:methionyl-tRNA synthetase